MFATDILKVFYAPHKVFKEIIQNPKYWGPLLVFIIVVAAQSGFYYAQSEKIYYEQTSPAPDKLGEWTTNSTLWTVNSGASVSNNYLDYLNNANYGNGSMQFAASGNTLSMTLATFKSIDCGPSNFQNLSMRVKQLNPQTAPTQATITLYSLSDSNTYQYDLTSQLSNASLIGTWNNITIPIGTNAAGWQSNGNPQWTNITGLKLEFNYASNSNVTLRLTGLFFRGEYKTFNQISSTGLIITVLQQALFQFVFEWLFLTGLMYIIIKALKGTVTFRPIFICVGFLLIVVAVQAVITAAATTILPIIYSPIELQAQLAGEAQTISNSLTTLTQDYTLITGIVQLAVYAWIVALGAFIVRAVQPEFTYAKCVLTAAASLIVTIILMSLLGV